MFTIDGRWFLMVFHHAVSWWFSPWHLEFQIQRNQGWHDQTQSKQHQKYLGIATFWVYIFPVLCVCKDIPCGCILSIYNILLYIIIYNILLYIYYIYILLYIYYIIYIIYSIYIYTCEWVFDQKIVDFPRLHFFMQKMIVWTRLNHRMLGSCFQTKPMKKNCLWTMPVRSKQGGVHWKKLEILCRK